MVPSPDLPRPTLANPSTHIVKWGSGVGRIMARGSKGATVLRVDGPVVLDWGNGVRIQISPAGIASHPVASPASASPRKAAGRPPSPATLKLREAMQADAQAHRPKTRAAYLQLLADAGGPSSPNAAGIIVNREAKRAFGKPLGRGKGKAQWGAKGRKGGRQASPGTVALREKLQADKSNGGLRDAPHYVRWLVDQPGVKMGLKQARPVAYRELRQARA